MSIIRLGKKKLKNNNRIIKVQIEEGHKIARKKRIEKCKLKREIKCKEKRDRKVQIEKGYKVQKEKGYKISKRKGT